MWYFSSCPRWEERKNPTSCSKLDEIRWDLTFVLFWITHQSSSSFPHMWPYDNTLSKIKEEMSPAITGCFHDPYSHFGAAQDTAVVVGVTWGQARRQQYVCLSLTADARPLKSRHFGWGVSSEGTKLSARRVWSQCAGKINRELEHLVFSSSWRLRQNHTSPARCSWLPLFWPVWPWQVSRHSVRPSSCLTRNLRFMHVFMYGWHGPCPLRTCQILKEVLECLVD